MAVEEGRVRSHRLPSLALALLCSGLGLLVFPGDAAADLAGIIDLRPQTLADRHVLQSRIRQEMRAQALDGPSRAVQRVLTSGDSGLLKQEADKVLLAPLACASDLTYLSPVWRAFAIGLDVKNELLRHYEAQLQCAKDRGKNKTSQHLARLITNLMQAEALPPPAPAPGSQVKTLTLSVLRPKGAHIAVDHIWTARAPATLELEIAPHLLTLSLAGESTAALLNSPQDYKDVDASVSLRPLSGELLSVADQIRQWTEQERFVRGEDIAKVMRILDLKYIVIIRPDEELTLWRLDSRLARAELLGKRSNEVELFEMFAAEHTSDGDHAGGMSYASQRDALIVPEPEDEGGQRWWIIGGVVSAAVITSFIIVSTELGGETQRIEVNVP